MRSVLVDTDVVSFDFKGDTRAALYDPHLAGKLLVLSFMTIAKLTCGRWNGPPSWSDARHYAVHVDADAARAVVSHLARKPP